MTIRERAATAPNTAPVRNRARPRGGTALAVLCALSLAACASPTASSTSTGGSSASQPVASAQAQPTNGSGAGSAYSGDFTIDGLWKTSGGAIYSFRNGVVSASLFGFDGGPNGTYQLSDERSDGSYELYGSHITGGTVDYLVTVQDAKHITMTLQGEASFAPKKLTLTRQ